MIIQTKVFLLPAMILISCYSFGNVHYYLPSKIISVTDTVKKFNCKCGNTEETKSMVSAPVKINGHTFYKTYFRFSNFFEKHYDYLTIINDTVFIVPGTKDVRSPDFFESRDVLCVLKNEPKVYERKILIMNGFFQCFVFKRKHFDVKIRRSIYSFALSTCGHNETADIPFLKEMSFTRSGEIVAFTYDLIDSVWACKKINR